MALAINNNLMANNVARNLNTHYGELGRSTQRLSSGLRVSSAADDAAGLAIRELMRGDIAALNQGARNANDAISMIQTADGALGVIDSKLIRMKELAEQSSTDTYTDEQRKLINQEYQAMADEITRIAKDTDFNGKKLLNGTGSQLAEETGTAAPTTAANFATHNQKGKFTITATADDAVTVTNNNRFGFTTATEYTVKAGEKVTYTQHGGKFGAAGQKVTVDKDETNAAVDTRSLSISADLKSQYAKAADAGTLLVETSADDGVTWNKVALTGAAQDLGPGNDIRFTIDDGTNKRVDTIMVVDEGGGATTELTFNSGDGSLVTKTAGKGTLDVSTVESTVINVHFGSSSAGTDSYNVTMGRSDAAALGVGEDAGDTVLTQAAAKQALDNLDNAIKMKDSTRADLGSTQNRLDATIENITIQKENIQAAESRISDVDVATEMTEFNRQQILANAAVSMLSQANNLPQMAQKLLG